MSSNKINKLVSDINKKFTPEGAEKSVIQTGDNLTEVEYIPACSYALGYAMGQGGWPVGKLIELFGPEGAGKTTLLLMGLRDIYEAYEGERVVALIDIEHRFNPDWATKLGLEVDENLIVAQPPTAEAATDIMIHLIKSGEVAAIGFDSIGGVAPEKEATTFEDQNTMYGGAAKVMSRNVRVVGSLANLYNVTCIYVNHVRADMSGYNRIITPGGHAVKHHMSQRLYIRRGKDRYTEKTGEGEVQVGFPMVFKNYKNSFGIPFREQWSDFYFIENKTTGGIGFDINKELQRLAIAMGIVERKGPWFFYDEVKAHGRENFFAELEAEGLLDDLKQDVMQRFATDATNSDEAEEKLADDPELAKPATDTSLDDILNLS